MVKGWRMNYKQTPIYLCFFTKEWNKQTQKEGSIAGHEFGKLNDRCFALFNADDGFLPAQE